MPMSTPFADASEGLNNHSLLDPLSVQAELDSLRSLRRRSLSQPSEGRIDLDLPNGLQDLPSPTSPTSPTNVFSADEDTPLTGALNSLFWLPARLHPEVAPQEFRAFLKEQTKPENLLRRHGSLGRKKSTLSRQYTPTATDESQREQGEVDERPPVSPTHASSSKSPLDTLTISDLQRLEELASEIGAGPSQESDARLRSLLQRNISRDGSASPATPDSDSPLIVPAPGSILRRSARTKIRKSSLSGDGGGHRFGPSRRSARISGSSELGSQLDNSGEIDTQSEDSHDPSTSTDNLVAFPSYTPTAEDTHGLRKPRHQSAQIYPTATASPVANSSQRASTSDLPPLAIETRDLESRPQIHQRSVSGDSFLEAYLNSASPSSSPQDGRHTWSTSPAGQTNNEDRERFLHTAFSDKSPSSALSPSSASPPKVTSAPSHIASPAAAGPSKQPLLHPLASPKPPQPTPIPVPVANRMQEREKKSAWAKLMSRSQSSRDLDADEGLNLAASAPHKKGKRKGKMSIDSVEDPPGSHRYFSKDAVAAAHHPKDASNAGFFGGLFSSKKKQEAEQTVNVSPQPVEISPTASGMLIKGGRYTNFYRLPIHVERAIYRLSHIKLANPRRALYEQVLISNLMFWYLGVVQARPPVQHVAEQHSQNSSVPSKEVSESVPQQLSSESSNSFPDTSYDVRNEQFPREADQYEANDYGTSSEQSPLAPEHSRSRSASSVDDFHKKPTGTANRRSVPEERPPSSPPILVQKRVSDKSFEVFRTPGRKSPNQGAHLLSQVGNSNQPRRPGLPPREASLSDQIDPGRAPYKAQHCG